MATIKKRMDAKQKRETIGMLMNLIERIENGEFEVKSKGFWRGTVGNWTFRVDVKESELPEDSE